MDHEILVLDFDGHFGAVAADGVEKSFADVEVERVAEFVGAGYAAGFDAGGEVARVVTPEAAAAKRSEKILQRFETEKIYRLVGDFEADLRLVTIHGLADGAPRGGLIGRSDLGRLLRIDVAFLPHA